MKKCPCGYFNHIPVGKAGICRNCGNPLPVGKKKPTGKVVNREFRKLMEKKQL